MSTETSETPTEPPAKDPEEVVEDNLDDWVYMANSDLPAADFARRVLRNAGFEEEIDDV